MLYEADIPEIIYSRRIGASTEAHEKPPLDFVRISVRNSCRAYDSADLLITRLLEAICLERRGG